jgi:hypothetical protein
MNGGLSKTYAELLADLVPTGLSSKTSPAFLVQTKETLLPESLVRWPKTGSLRNGHVYERPTLEPPTSDFVGSASATPTTLSENLTFPTPSSQEPGYKGPLVDKNGNPVEHVAQRCYDPATGRLVQTGLPQAIKMLPTPTSQAGKHGATPDVHANAFGYNLWDIPHLLPTPTASEHKYRLKGNSQQSKCLAALAKQGKLTNGVLMPSPSQDGNQSLEDQRQTPPTKKTD